MKIADALTTEFNVLDNDEYYIEDADWVTEAEIVEIILKAANRPRRGIEKVKPSS